MQFNDYGASKFKVGDRVRYIGGSASGYTNGDRLGTVGTVRGVTQNLHVAFDGDAYEAIIFADNVVPNYQPGDAIQLNSETGAAPSAEAADKHAKCTVGPRGLYQANWGDWYLDVVWVRDVPHIQDNGGYLPRSFERRVAYAVAANGIDALEARIDDEDTSTSCGGYASGGGGEPCGGSGGGAGWWSTPPAPTQGAPKLAVTTDAVVAVLRDYVAREYPHVTPRNLLRPGVVVVVDDADLDIKEGLIVCGPDEDGDYRVAVIEKNGEPNAFLYSLEDIGISPHQTVADLRAATRSPNGTTIAAA